MIPAAGMVQAIDINKLKKDAEEGNFQAQVSLGYSYKVGENNLPVDLKQAMEWFARAAVQKPDEMGGMNNLISCLDLGEPLPDNVSKILQPMIDALIKKANEGDLDAQVTLGYYCEKGVCFSKKHALEWFAKVASQDPYKMGGMNNLITLLESGKPLPENVRKILQPMIDALIKKANEGDINSQATLGYYCKKGVCLSRKHALEWFAKAAAQDPSRGMDNLITFLESGKSLPENVRKILQPMIDALIKKANSGDVQAQKDLGYYCMKDVCLSKNEATYWFSKVWVENGVFGIVGGADRLMACLQEGIEFSDEARKILRSKLKELMKSLIPYNNYYQILMNALIKQFPGENLTVSEDNKKQAELLYSNQAATVAGSAMAAQAAVGAATVSVAAGSAAAAAGAGAEYWLNSRSKNIMELDTVLSELAKYKIQTDGKYLPEPELALRRAAVLGNLKDLAFIKLLIKNVQDLDINKTGPTSGKTALDFAESKGKDAAAELLKAHGGKNGVNGTPKKKV